MHAVIVNRAPIPVFAYGGTERVIWDLGRALVALGHTVTYLVPKGSSCDFAQVVALEEGSGSQSLAAQIDRIQPAVDVVHVQFVPEAAFINADSHPYVMTQHGNPEVGEQLPLNTVFVSRNHAQRHQSEHFVHNGLDWSAYGDPQLDAPRDGFHFLGKAAWRVKNVQGAIRTARLARQQLHVLGGDRFNFRRGVRLTWSPQVHFYGMVGGSQKLQALARSRGLIFPVRWHEPFGLAVIESLYFGCPVFATPYGALPELVPPNCGALHTSAKLLARAVTEALEHPFDARACHDQALRFNAQKMALDYLKYYKAVQTMKPLHEQPPHMGADCKNLPWTN